MAFSPKINYDVDSTAKYYQAVEISARF